MANPTVVIIATLDTKAPAAAFLRDEIAAWDVHTILIDPGILGEPPILADITRYQVAQAAGTTLGELRATGEKRLCIAKQTEGLCRIVQQLWTEGRLDGVVGLGGGQGTSIGTAAMRVLPVGVPKLMVSTIASGFFQFGSYVGTKDLCMMHSVTDILDVNSISRPILRNAANSIAGMALRRVGAAVEDRPAIAITQLGMTTPCVMRIKGLLEEQGYQLIPFHANGTGGPAMEDLVDAGKFVGVVDLSVHEIIDGLHDGLAGAKNRFESLTRNRIPAVISTGGNDYLLWENMQKTPEKFRDRKHVIPNPQMIGFIPTVDEMIQAAQAMVDPLNRALGPTLVVVPSIGFTDMNKPGSDMWTPEGNQAMIETLRGGLRREIPLIVMQAHINDPVFADTVADCMGSLLKGESPQSIARRFLTPAGALEVSPA